MRFNHVLTILKDHLETKGVLNKIRTSLKSEIFNALKEDESTPHTNLSKENILINDLIREYLEFNNYSYSKSVFDSESGNPKERLGRDIITSELNVIENKQTRQLPLLYSLIFGGKEKIDETGEKDSVNQMNSGFDYKNIFEVDRSK